MRGVVRAERRQSRRQEEKLRERPEWKVRRVSMVVGTVAVRKPRVRGFEERFESRILPLFKRRTEEVGELLPQLYLYGLAQGDFELALRGLLGDGGAAFGLIH